MNSRSVPGPVAFARFAYPPNALGYCGPPHPELLLGAASEGTAIRELTGLASRFEGAWLFLELIASSNGIGDPLDPRVVEAYWIGNSLLERVPTADLAQQLESRFERRAGHDLSSATRAARLGGAPHHSFQVFAVYPWLALLRDGKEATPLNVLDRCRIRWGTVLSVNGDTATVRDRSLAFRSRQLVEGPERIEDARRSLDGVGFTEDLMAGDAVALHWDWVCQRLTAAAVQRLRLWTNRMLDVVNASEP